MIWNLVRAPILAILMLLEPVVGGICMGAMILGLLAAVTFEISAAAPHFPFLGVTAASLGFGLAYVLYQCLVARLLK